MSQTTDALPEIGSIEPNRHGYRTFTLGGFTGHGPGFDQHHSFPGLPPLRVVTLVTANRAGQRTRFAFGPKPEIDAKQVAFGRHARDLRNERLRQTEKELVVA